MCFFAILSVRARLQATRVCDQLLVAASQLKSLEHFGRPPHPHHLRQHSQPPETSMDSVSQPWDAACPSLFSKRNDRGRRRCLLWLSFSAPCPTLDEAQLRSTPACGCQSCTSLAAVGASAYRCASSIQILYPMHALSTPLKEVDHPFVSLVILQSINTIRFVPPRLIIFSFTEELALTEPRNPRSP